MRGQLRARLNPATIIATLALCFAIGGGYALAFSGTGSVKTKVYFPTSTYGKAIAVKGMGQLQMRCDSTSGLNFYRFVNTTAASLVQQRAFETKAATYTSDDIGPNSNGAEHATNANDIETVRLELFSGSAMATVTLVTAAAGDSCSSAHMMATSSVE